MYLGRIFDRMMLVSYSGNLNCLNSGLSRDKSSKVKDSAQTLEKGEGESHAFNAQLRRQRRSGDS